MRRQRVLERVGDSFTDDDEPVPGVPGDPSTTASDAESELIEAAGLGWLIELAEVAA
jgi:hypothetical protein